MFMIDYTAYMTNTSTGWHVCYNLIIVFILQVPLHLDGVPFLLPLAPPTPLTMPHPLPTAESLVMIVSHSPSSSLSLPGQEQPSTRVIHLMHYYSSLISTLIPGINVAC